MVISSPKMVPGHDLAHDPRNVAMRASADMPEFAIDAIASTKKQPITATEHICRLLEVLSSLRIMRF